jgi:hypothetical protein
MRAQAAPCDQTRVADTSANSHLRRRTMSKATALALRSNGIGSKCSSPNARARTRTGRWRAAFLKALREVPSVTNACAVARIDRATAYRHKSADEAFAEAWEDALGTSVDNVEHRAFEKALEGDPQLMAMVLKAYRPERYGDRQRIDHALLGGIVLIPAKENGNE